MKGVSLFFNAVSMENSRTTSASLKKTILFAVIALGLVGLAGCSHEPINAENPLSFTFTEENTEAPLYTDFSQQRYSELLGKKPFAIFFYAGWCPDCVNLEEKIKANIADFPGGSVILKADYDTESELKKEYGITVQSTVVVIDKNGNAAPTLFGPSVLDLKDAMVGLLW